MASNEAVRSLGLLAPASRRRFLSPRRAAVLEAATRQLMPAADEADVVGYLDRLLSLLDAQSSAGPVRAADLRDHYTRGIALLDELAGGDFTAVTPLQQSLVVSHTEATPFMNLLFDHIVEVSPTRRMAAFR